MRGFLSIGIFFSPFFVAFVGYDLCVDLVFLGVWHSQRRTNIEYRILGMLIQRLDAEYSKSTITGVIECKYTKEFTATPLGAKSQYLVRILSKEATVASFGGFRRQAPRSGSSSFRKWRKGRRICLLSGATLRSPIDSLAFDYMTLCAGEPAE